VATIDGVLMVATDDISPPGQLHGLGLVSVSWPRFVIVSATNGAASLSTNSRTSLSLRSRAPRIYRRRRASSSAMASALTDSNDTELATETA
jgi:hypothetical protein